MPWTFPKAATCIISKQMENIIGKYYSLLYFFLFFPEINFTKKFLLQKSNNDGPFVVYFL